MSTPSLPTLIQRPSRARFLVLGFICTLSLITYIDRVCISRVQGDIQRDLKISDEHLGLIFGAFGVGYMLFEIPGGWMGDRWGSRRVLLRIVVWWSIFTALTGCIWPFTLDSGWSIPLPGGGTLPLLLNGLVALILVRFLFGAGEAGAYPNIARVVGVWFPYRERASAQGAVWMSARLGGAIAPVLIGRLTVGLGWRQAFWVLGLMGVAWGIVFYIWFRDRPEQVPGCNEAERELIRSDRGPSGAAGHGHGLPPLGALLGSLTMWAACIAAFGVSFGWYFYPTWQPRYLQDVFGISFGNSEILTGLPFLCGAIGSLVGGGLSDWLIARTGSRRWGRSLIGLGGFGIAGICVFLTGLTTAPWQAVVLLCLAFLINDLAIPVIWAVAADVGGRYVGTVAGLMNSVGAIGAILCPALVPIILNAFPAEWDQAQRWRWIFAGLAASWFVAAAAWLFIDASKPLFGKEEPTRPRDEPPGPPDGPRLQSTPNPAEDRFHQADGIRTP
jgi:MFS family permease